ncbi:hypothetical protein [Accumulibacter sp.]|nr:hypothetical protein [Accumulibacter sp.]HPU81205.1 hypothetical protein [Accumulibacter sp.]
MLVFVARVQVGELKLRRFPWSLLRAVLFGQQVVRTLGRAPRLSMNASP